MITSHHSLNPRHFQIVSVRHVAAPSSSAGSHTGASKESAVPAGALDCDGPGASAGAAGGASEPASKRRRK